ncbi:hypothetical protein AOLI_G00091860 [Acnodon oligacanthus]
MSNKAQQRRPLARAPRPRDGETAGTGGRWTRAVEGGALTSSWLELSVSFGNASLVFQPLGSPMAGLPLPVDLLPVRDLSRSQSPRAYVPPSLPWIRPHYRNMRSGIPHPKQLMLLTRQLYQNRAPFLIPDKMRHSQCVMSSLKEHCFIVTVRSVMHCCSAVK